MALSDMMLKLGIGGHENLYRGRFVENTSRVCTKCNVRKFFFNFPKANKGAYGYSATCLDCTNSWHKNAYYENHEETKKQKREYAKARRINPLVREKARAATKRWQENNKDKRKEYCINRASEKHEHIRASHANRRAHKLGCEGIFTGDDVKKIMSSQNNTCAYCKKILDGRNYVIDHIIPLAAGGSNWPSNLQMLCINCNSRKSCMSHEAFSRRFSDGS